MKVARLQADNVHGYLGIDIEFHEDLTFLTGLNGSGKTSALRLLIALLTPNLEELATIEYSSASVTFREGDAEIVVAARKSEEGLVLSLSPTEESVVIGTADLELYVESRIRDDPRSPIAEKYARNPLIERIRAISTPMFLGLDRRFFGPADSSDPTAESRRRELMARRYWQEERGSRTAQVGSTAALIEVNYLVVTKMQEVRAAQEVLDDNLRNRVFANAFEYKPNEIGGTATRLPKRSEIDLYREQLSKIERAAEVIRVPVPEISVAVRHFFDRMTKTVDSIERNQIEGQAVGKKAEKRATRKQEGRPPPLDGILIEWIVNRPQADRILEHLSLLERYIEDRTALRESVDRFVTLVNGFLRQTRKSIYVASNGQLRVKIDGFKNNLQTNALSSGERQLLVMLAHLSLNPSLEGSGVFIVDEPELSLHIDWQERFVDAVREANPSVQLILATHSPAIILDRIESCRSMDERVMHA